MFAPRRVGSFNALASWGFSSGCTRGAPSASVAGRAGNCTSNTVPVCCLPRSRTAILPCSALDERTDDEQPQAGAGLERSNSLPKRTKRPKIFRRSLRRNPSSVVDDARHDDVVTGKLRFDFDDRLGAAVLDGVVDQVAEDHLDVDRPRPHDCSA